MGRVNVGTFMNTQRKGEGIYFALMESGNPSLRPRKRDTNNVHSTCKCRALHLDGRLAPGCKQ